MGHSWQVLKHKWFVFLAGRKVSCSLWRLLWHDVSKFLPSERRHYVRQIHGSADDPEGFMRAWIHHQNHNDHHWEYWIPRTGHDKCDPPHEDNRPVKMSMAAVREMVADWLGASRAYGGEWPTSAWWPWLCENWPKIKPRLDQWTIARVCGVLSAAGYDRIFSIADGRIHEN